MPVKRRKQKKKAARSRGGAKSTMVSLDQIWPQERDYMARPERYKYVRRLVMPEGCVFCHAASRDPGFESLCLFRSKYSMVLLNKYPYNSGHLLVVPLRHCGDLLELAEDEYLDASQLLRISMANLRSAYNPEGFNLGLNHGAVAGAGLPGHLHWHIVPRWHGDTNFFPLIAETKVLPETLEQSFERLLTYFKPGS